MFNYFLSTNRLFYCCFVSLYIFFNLIKYVYEVRKVLEGQSGGRLYYLSFKVEKLGQDLVKCLAEPAVR